MIYREEKKKKGVSNQELKELLGFCSTWFVFKGGISCCLKELYSRTSRLTLPEQNYFPQRRWTQTRWWCSEKVNHHSAVWTWVWGAGGEACFPMPTLLSGFSFWPPLTSIKGDPDRTQFLTWFSKISWCNVVTYMSFCSSSTKTWCTVYVRDLILKSWTCLKNQNPH